MNSEEYKRHRSKPSICRLTGNRLIVSMLVLVWSILARGVESPMRIMRDIEYMPSGHERQKLDLYLPAEPRD